jgi:hypothetical protein
MSQPRTKIAIIGADPSSFHIFNTLYRSDDRFEVHCFFSIDPNDCPFVDRYPPTLSGPSYTSGIPIYHDNPFQQRLIDNKIERCLFTSSCVTSSLYLFLAAQCLAANCSVVSLSLESTQQPPQKPLVSFFADTQFDGQILFKLLSHYRKNLKAKPAVVFPASLSLISPNRDEGLQFLTARNQAELERIWAYSGNHERQLWKDLILANYQLFFVFDSEGFQNHSLSDTTFDMVVFVGFNTLPCFFQSHLIVYACDDFTFGPEITQHPSSILCKQADVIIVAELRGTNVSDALRNFVGRGTHIHTFSVSFKAGYPKDLGMRRVLLVDDGYPVIKCNAVDSISKYIAEQAKLRPIELKGGGGGGGGRSGKSPVYYEPTERDWPALIMPDRLEQITQLLEGEQIGEEMNYDLVLLTISGDVNLGQRRKPFVQVKFDCERLELPEEALRLPPAAFVRRSK